MKQISEDVAIAETDLVYIGEGNANLVVGLKDKNLVLRFRKGEIYEKGIEDKLNNVVFYFHHVIHPRIGGRFLSPLLLVRITHSDLELLKKRISEERPADRRKKDIYHPVALLMPDLTSPRSHFSSTTTGPTLSVEIKPKNGFLVPENCPHPSLCNYCLKQFYKLKNGAVDRISEYCPLDLFSGDINRMSNALQALMDCPQNNLRIFGDGELLHSSSTTNVERCNAYIRDMFGSVDSLIRLLVTALMSNYQTDSRHRLCTNKSSSKPATLTNDTENSNCDLKPMKFSSCGRRSLSPLKGRTQSFSIHEDPTSDEPSAGPVDGSVLRTLFDLQAQNELTDKSAKVVLDELLNTGRSLEDLQSMLLDPSKADQQVAKELHLLAKYLLCATAKDVSIFVTFRRDYSSDMETFPSICLNGAKFSFSIKVVDLDPKHVSKISKYATQKEKWLKSLI